MKLLDLILPVRCVVCAAPGQQLCQACCEALPRLRLPLCARCGKPTAWPVERCSECAGRRLGFATARAAVAYDDRVRRLVQGWKERGLRRLAATAADVVADALAAPAVDAITFVPPDRARGLERGHHPAERLARELGARWALTVEPLLARARPAARQRGLSLSDRRRNVAGAFAPARASPRAVALVDDVYTSGSTANAAASALRTAGARRIEVITFARVVR
ncbi:MAG TPA: double zinc ribbon domain-containing protein [Gaiellaceae bacterium]|nr:double zinc ribbon domain-containing protein [Gaiellaceae bacterium]